MPDPEKEPQVEILDSEPEENLDTPSNITVDLEKKPDQKSDDKPRQEAPKSSADIQKLHNTIAYQTRQFEKAMREIADYKAQIASRPQPPVQKESETQDEIDKIAERDWKQGVKKVVEKDIEAKVQEILSKREQALNEVQKRTAMESELEKSKQRVFQKYPTIEDVGTDESRIYREVINEDNSLLSNIHGPEIAMYRMEEKMRAAGRVLASERPIITQEAQRLVRAGASSVVGRQASPSGKVTLSKEQKQFCDHYKIPYEQYAKNLKAMAGGAEV